MTSNIPLGKHSFYVGASNRSAWQRLYTYEKTLRHTSIHRPALTTARTAHSCLSMHGSQIAVLSSFSCEHAPNIDCRWTTNTGRQIENKRNAEFKFEFWFDLPQRRRQRSIIHVTTAPRLSAGKINRKSKPSTENGYDPPVHQSSLNKETLNVTAYPQKFLQPPGVFPAKIKKQKQK